MPSLLQPWLFWFTTHCWKHWSGTQQNPEWCLTPHLFIRHTELNTKQSNEAVWLNNCVKRVCVCVCVLTVQRLRVGQVFLELFIQVFTDADVLEHSLQFGRVLEPARLLQENKKKSGFSRRFPVCRDAGAHSRELLWTLSAVCESVTPWVWRSCWPLRRRWRCSGGPDVWPTS